LKTKPNLYDYYNPATRDCPVLVEAGTAVIYRHACVSFYVQTEILIVATNKINYLWTLNGHSVHAE